MSLRRKLVPANQGNTRMNADIGAKLALRGGMMMSIFSMSRSLAGILPYFQWLMLAGILGLGFSQVAGAVSGQATKFPAYCKDARVSGLPLPSSLPEKEYQKRLYEFLKNYEYRPLKWCVDKTVNNNPVRETGAYIKNVYYGTHPAVRVYYSPGFMHWLAGGDRSKQIKDGAIIVKEMYPPPAERYKGMTVQELRKHLMGWTVMVREKGGAHDGWYWASLFKGHMKPDSDAFPFKPKESGFGQYCLRCHASARDHSTFSGLRNVKGFPGEPIRFRIDDSWRKLSANEKPWQPHASVTKPDLFVQHMSPLAFNAPSLDLDPKPAASAFSKFFQLKKPVVAKEVVKLPGEALDRVVATGMKGPSGFLSSDQCMMCHSGISGHKSSAAGPNMFVQTGPKSGQGYNISPYGEWRWSPMGLAGRDPIFHAQLDSEITLLRKEFAKTPKKADLLVRHLQNTCLSCHAVMGQRQLAQDARKKGLDPLFRREYLYLGSKDQSNPYHKYGALGRDGISCTVCHRMVPPKADPQLSALKNYLTHATTGKFSLAAPGKLLGPYANNKIVTLPMKNALGMTPQFNKYIKSSRLCGSCHMVNLPNVDQPHKADTRTMLDAGQKNPVFKPFKHSIEQATYLEWLNSVYQNEYPSVNPDPKKMKTCQACHMPSNFKNADGTINIKTVKTRIAAIQDHTYPEADHTARARDIHVRFRQSGYNRHRFQGLNAFLVQMFKQRNDILGVRKKDLMTGSYGLKLAMENYQQQARERTADINLKVQPVQKGTLVAAVKIVNKTGHRFPSGVGFRRAFVEFVVTDTTTGRVLWGSGRTNAVGAIVDGNNKVLASEFFDTGPDGKQSYQRHHEVITRQDQVQIYEELIQNAKRKFTTSFIHRKYHVKDNRLLPLGWRPKGQDSRRYKELKAFIDATHPGPDAGRDKEYRSGSGTDWVEYRIRLPAGVDPRKIKVRATLYYQSIPPSWLRQRFKTAPDMAATRRLHYIASRLDLKGTPLENWKFKLVSAEQAVPSR